MTLEEAIKYAEAVAQAKEREAKENRNQGGWAYDDEAEKCSACAAEHRQLAEWLKELKKRREQDVPDANVGDTISRQAAIDCFWTKDRHFRDALDVIKDIRQLPPAQPEGIPLEWINKHLERLDNFDNDFAQLAKVSIRAMVEIWKKDRI